MAKIKLTKNELRKQKDSLKRFNRYLPTLQLKKQQLQVERNRIQHKLKEVQVKIQDYKQSVDAWVDVFAEDVKLRELIKVEKVEIGEGNIAGVDIPVLEKVIFKETEYDLFITPLWVDSGIEALKNTIKLIIEYETIERQLEAIKEELRITTQRVNLFEKIKIPESKEHIKKIQISLADLQTAGVVRGKIAKEKIHKKQQILLSI